jgi:hypothetical protein
VLEQLEQRAQRSVGSFANLLTELVTCYENPVYLDDEWYRMEVPLDQLYCAHEDFRHHPVFKDARYIDFMPGLRQKIDADCFPCSFEIRAPWKGPAPEPLVKEREPGKFYVPDGQLRVIRQWYHNVSNVRVLVYRGHHLY